MYIACKTLFEGFVLAEQVGSAHSITAHSSLYRKITWKTPRFK